MGKTLIALALVIAAIVGIMYGVQALGRHTSGAYKLAEQMKAQGLNYDTLKVTGSTSMYQEITLQGKDLMVKISHYGNGLFLKQVKSGLAKDKKARNAKEPIYLAGAYLVVVYREPSKGMVKDIMVKFFPEVEEY